MGRWLCVFLVTVLVLGNVGLGGASVPAGETEPQAVVGGISWVCPALGFLTGVSLATGQWISAAGFAVTAIRSGCVI